MSLNIRRVLLCFISPKALISGFTGHRPNQPTPMAHNIRCTQGRAKQPLERGMTMSGVEDTRGGYGCGGYGGGFTNTGAILVLFILLVIITKSFLC